MKTNIKIVFKTMNKLNIIITCIDRFYYYGFLQINIICANRKIDDIKVPRKPFKSSNSDSLSRYFDVICSSVCAVPREVEDADKL